MTESGTLTVSIIGALILWTTTVASLALWLAGKFRQLEQLIYREMSKHQHEDDQQFRRHELRLQRLELKAFNFTESEPRSNGNGSMEQ